MTPLPPHVSVVANDGRTIEFPLSGDWRADVERAVEREHPCKDRGCDIREAVEHGFPLSAAYLLSGATETPILDAVRAVYVDAGATPDGDFAELPTTLSEDWRGWCEHHDEHGYACPSCGGVTYDDASGAPTQCAACRVTLSRDYVVAVVFHVRARSAGEAFTKVQEDEVEDALFSTNVIEAEERDITDPDYEVIVRSHGREMTPVPADEEGTR